MRALFGLTVALGLAALLPLACSNNPAPASPENPSAPTFTATPIPTLCGSCTFTFTFIPTGTPTLSPTVTRTPAVTPTITPTSPILFYAADVYWRSDTSPHQDAEVYLNVSGTPEATAGVTLTGPSVPSGVQAFYQGPVPYNSMVFSHYDTTAYTYQPGQNYTFTCHTSGGDASVTLTTTGPITVSPDGLTISWGTGGDTNAVSIYHGASLVASYSPLVSPFSVPATVYSTPGVYPMTVQLVKCATPVNAQMAGSYCAQTSYLMAVTLYSSVTTTPTPFPTDTPTFTPTPTWTSTPTVTFTPTPLCASPSYFGKGSGASSGSFTNLLDANRYNLSVPGTVTALIAYLPSASGSIRMAIYSDNAGSPANLLAETASQSVNLDTNILPLSPPLALPAGNYWLAYQIQGSSTIAYDTGAAASEAYVTSFTYGSFPVTFPAFTFSNFNWYLEGRYCP